MENYKSLKKQAFNLGKYSLVPIRFDDRHDIMKWRNDQIYHLRQNKVLTIEDQDLYFENTIKKLFEREKPNQILFSFLYENKLIGYGGLVHINWNDKNAEISFIMDTLLEKKSFIELWRIYLKILQTIAFIELSFHKIYTYAFDLRPNLYIGLESMGFKKEATLKNHCFFNENFIDVIIHSKFSQDYLKFQLACEEDLQLYYIWVNENVVRKNSINQKFIEFEEHKKWFLKKIKDLNSQMYILKVEDDFIGQIRIDNIEGFWYIDYSIDKKFRNLGFGKKILELLLDRLNNIKLKAKVKKSNVASIKVFDFFNFEKNEIQDEYFEFTKILL